MLLRQKILVEGRHRVKSRLTSIDSFHGGSGVWHVVLLPKLLVIEGNGWIYVILRLPSWRNWLYVLLRYCVSQRRTVVRVITFVLVVTGTVEYGTQKKRA